MATKSISQMDTAVAVDNGTLLEVATPDVGSASGYTSEKVSVAQLADHNANSVNYPDLQTTAKTLVGAINEAAQTGGGGTTVVANPSGTPTDTLNTVQIENTVYDIAGTGGGEHIYSTTEHPVGRWIDGKTVYEKSIRYAFNGESGSRTIQIPHGVSNMETVVSYEGIMNHATVTPYGEYFPSKDATFGRTSVKQTNIELSISGSWEGYILWLTIRYTKSAS